MAGAGAEAGAIGRPFIIGGDWQVQPDCVLQSKLNDVLDAHVCAPTRATNVLAGSILDYFLVSNVLLQGDWCIDVVEGCAFSPHMPVMIELPIRVASGEVTRLTQPRMLPVHRITGPLPMAETVDWSQWEEPRSGNGDKAGVVQDVAEKLDLWYAGAGVELMGALGISGSDRDACSGIGAAPT